MHWQMNICRFRKKLIMEEPITSHVLHIIKTRRSIRAFLSDTIPEDDLDQLIEALRWAPSAGNRQPWHFFLIHNELLKQKLVQAAFGQNFIAQAPVVFVVCAIPEQSAVRYGSRGKNLYTYQDTAAAVQNLLLTATDLGYGACWVGAFDEKKAVEALHLPEKYRPIAIVPVGKAGERPAITPRATKTEIVTNLE